MNEVANLLLDLVRIVLSLTATLGVPVFVGMGVKYFSKRWGLEISERQAQRVEAIAEGIVYDVEASMPGKGNGRQKLAAATGRLQQLGGKLGIAVDSGMARSAIERALRWGINRAKG